MVPNSEPFFKQRLERISVMQETDLLGGYFWDTFINASYMFRTLFLFKNTQFQVVTINILVDCKFSGETKLNTIIFIDIIQGA